MISKKYNLTGLDKLHRLTMTLLFKNDIENTNDFVVGEYITAFQLEDTTYE